MLEVFWSDRIEDLANRLMRDLAAIPRSDPFKKEVVLTSTPTMGAWLRHYALLDRRCSFTNIESTLLFTLVNDWLHRLDPNRAGEVREPRFHPYSKQCLQWRIFRIVRRLTATSDSVFTPLRDYVGDDSPPERIFELASEIADLFGDYQVYRPDMLIAWEEGEPRFAGVRDRWQVELWRNLIAEDPDSQLRDFRMMEERLPDCGFIRELDRLSVFGVSGMPPVFLHFLDRVGEVLPTRLYAFNPCADFWLEDYDAKRAALIGLDENPDEHLETGNPLLTSLGKYSQSFCRELFNRVDECDILPLDVNPDDSSVLRAIQNDMRSRRWIDDQGGALERRRFSVSESDDSISIQACHHPRREVEVLRDHLARWFKDDPDLQPRHAQVLIPNLDDYVPYVEAIFGEGDAAAIPYVVAERPGSGINQVSASFAAILELPRKRFTATEVMEILECSAVARRFDFSETDLPTLGHLVNEAGVRWGIDERRRETISGAAFEASTSWRRGLDRLLLGFAMGRGGEDHGAIANAGELGLIAPCDDIESETARLTGKLACFFDALVQAVDDLSRERPLNAWSEALGVVIDAFFNSDSATYRDVTHLRSIVAGLARGGETAGYGEEDLVPATVVAAYVENQLEATRERDALIKNAVVFSSLAPGACAPRPIVCLLGMNDGEFPRQDNRPLFDLTRLNPRHCDPSARLIDREAFLEAMLAVRHRLYVSYLGRSEKQNEPLPPSTVVCELIDYLKAGFDLPEDQTAWDGSKVLWCETIHHLQPFHPDYFITDPARRLRTGLFSFSREDCAAANALLNRRKKDLAESVSESEEDFEATLESLKTSEEKLNLDASDLVNFFKNPAKAYYKNILGVSFDDYDQVTFVDTEPFEIDALEGYGVDQRIIQRLLTREDLNDDDVRALALECKETGVVPLSWLGDEKLSERIDAIKHDLYKPFKTEGASEAFNDFTRSKSNLLELLRSETHTERIELTLENARLTGVEQLVDLGGVRRSSLQFRYASVKAKDQIAAWIRHVILNAAGLKTETVVTGKDNNQSVKLKPFAPLSLDEARGFLSTLIVVHRMGRMRPLPFTPATSLVYWKEVSGDIGSAERERALDKARNGWDGFKVHEFEDPYFAAAFDGRPPWEGLPEEWFHLCAKWICGPLLDAMKGGSR